MKFSALFLCFTALFAKADLPVMSDDAKWLGYFVAWDDKKFDFGLGGDGIGILHMMNGKDRFGHDDFIIHYQLQEEMGGKWVSRKILAEGGLASEAAPSLNSNKPVAVTYTYTGDTKVEFMMVKVRGEIVIKPKLIEKTTKNPVRVAVQIGIPNFFKYTEDLDDKELKKIMRSDYFSAVRASDGKKVKVKLFEKETDLLGEDFLEKGARELEFSAKKMDGKTFVVGQGSEKAGVLEITPKNPFYKGMKVLWIPDQAKLGEKDCFVTFSVE